MNRIASLCIGFCLTTAAALTAHADPIAGDVNDAGGVDAVDVQIVINGALGIGADPSNDIDFNGTTNAVDVQLVINAALNITIDSDSDGLADGAEANLGTDSNVFDTDGDGIGDGQEVQDGTNPLVPNSPPETHYQVTFTANGSFWRIEPKEAATPFNISTQLDLLATQPGGHQGPILVSPDGSYYSFRSERFDADSQAWVGLTIAPANLSSAETIKVNGTTIHGEGGQVTNGGNAVVYVDSGDPTVTPTPHLRDLWVVSRNKAGAWTGPVCITRDSAFAWNTWPVLSADCAKVLFDAGDQPYGAAGTVIAEVGISGTGYRVVVQPSDLPVSALATYCHSPAYEPTGAVVFESDGAGGEQVWRIPAGGGTPAVINASFSNDNSPNVLPDGRIVSLFLNSSSDPGKHEIKVMDTNGLNDATITTSSVLFDEVDDIGLGCGILITP